jgi:pantoate--beta-alanine ligase
MKTMPSMIHFQTRSDLIAKINTLKNEGKSVGFVPTMGALHQGHLSLVDRAVEECDVVVVSIYVNPLQFNNPEDLKNYPNRLEDDFKLLSLYPDLLVFTPTFLEVFPLNDDHYKVDLGEVETVLEGAHRPGHFLGVGKVVYALFDLVNPHKAYFGSKDYQQVIVIKKLVEVLGLKVEVIECSTQRDPNGLAMSSRNLLLSPTEKMEAAIIFKTLKYCQENVSVYTPQKLQSIAKTFFNKGSLRLEYLEIVSAEGLKPIDDWEQKSVCCIAAYSGKIRLIDNLVLN